MINLSWKGSAKDEIEETNRVSSFRGYLLKMRRSHNLLAPQWGKRWFSIEGRFLRWYRQESDISSSGMINLRNVRSITKVETSGCFTFCVSNEDRNLILRASTYTEMSGWVKALHMHADIARGGTGMNVVSDFNEVPLRSQGMLQSKKGNPRRSSLTLTQELEKNLRKLNDLELEISLQSSSGSPTSADRAQHARNGADRNIPSDNNQTKKKITKKEYDEFEIEVDDDDDDEFEEGNIRVRGKNNKFSTSNNGNEIHDEDDRSHAEGVSNNFAGSGSTAVPLTSLLLRTESVDSIESISLTNNTSIVNKTRRKDRQQHSNNNSNPLTNTPESSFHQSHATNSNSSNNRNNNNHHPSHHYRGQPQQTAAMTAAMTAIAAAGDRMETSSDLGELSDEFEASNDSAIDFNIVGPPPAVRSKNGATAGSGVSSNRNNNSNNSSNNNSNNNSSSWHSNSNTNQNNKNLANRTSHGSTTNSTTRNGTAVGSGAGKSLSLRAAPSSSAPSSSGIMYSASLERIDHEDFSYIPDISDRRDNNQYYSGSKNRHMGGGGHGSATGSTSSNSGGGVGGGGWAQQSKATAATHTTTGGRHGSRTKNAW
eukprot:CAMPEP_0174965784 /NCGR_PEP_ID=MMETSP0004_2-20121128/6627_1 /TAXON_ID=420556 /ORGANISM="Ochromonas sp., Strain CCMP1393" /LENGTH=595 /DNA_ID=CAMNT_0016214657 /DNA_START=80 /DNA_END=1867 /DNA_ORIENTATION=+